MITTINEFKKVNELFYVPKLRVPEEIDTTKDFKNINWNDIKIDELGDDGNKIIHLGITLPGENFNNPGIVLDIQLINNELYQIHLHLAKSLQGQGIGYKIYKKFIAEFGHVYSGHGRRLNDKEVPAIWNKLKNDPDVECDSTINGDICFLKNNVDMNLLQKYA